jgi:ElaB/YqjD/DUF883 family membrane-anchored ribosome-binding protein
VGLVEQKGGKSPLKEIVRYRENNPILIEPDKKYFFCLDASTPSLSFEKGRPNGMGVRLSKSAREVSMNRDGVSIAFESIIDELQKVAEVIADQGALAFKERRPDKAKRLSEAQKNLNSIIEKVKNLLKKWQADIKGEGGEVSVKGEKGGKKTRLRVRFNNGKVIEQYKAADTFALTIKEMGFSKVEALEVTLNGFQLVGHQKSNEYDQRQIDGWYVGTHSNTKAKKKILEKIASRLGVGLEVEIIPWNKPLHRTGL